MDFFLLAKGAHRWRENVVMAWIFKIAHTKAMMTFPRNQFGEPQVRQNFGKKLCWFVKITALVQMEGSDVRISFYLRQTRFRGDAPVGFLCH